MVRKKVLVTLGIVLALALTLTGAAFAHGGGFSAEKIDKAVTEGKLTAGQADVLKQLGTLREAAMTKLKADSKAVIEQAVKEGKLTQEQADKMLQGGPHVGLKGHGPGMRGDKGMMGKQGLGFRFSHNMTEDQLKAQLAEAVKAGKMTQEQADLALKRFQEFQQKKAQ